MLSLQTSVTIPNIICSSATVMIVSCLDVMSRTITDGLSFMVERQSP